MKKILVLLLLLPLFSCEEREVDVPLPAYSRKLVVNCLINNEDNIRVAVSYSVPSLGTDNPEYLSNALVEIYEDGLLLGPVTYDVFDKKYSVPVKPVQGRMYEVKVTHPDFPPVYAKAQLPPAVQFDDVDYIDSVGLDSSGGKLAAIRFTISDPVANENFYRLLFTYYSNALGQFLPIDFETNDEVLLSPQTIKEDAGSYLFNDGLFNGRTKTFEIRFPENTATGTPRYMVTVDALTQDYYRYRNSLRLFNENKDNPFAEPVLIYTNVQGGLGICAGYIIERDTVY